MTLYQLIKSINELTINIIKWKQTFPEHSLLPNLCLLIARPPGKLLASMQ